MQQLALGQGIKHLMALETTGFGIDDMGARTGRPEQGHPIFIELILTNRLSAFVLLSA